MQPRFTGLYRNLDFLKLWISQTLSLLGAQITALALPLVAVLVLNALPIQMGLLTALQDSPYLLIGLVAGVWVDRLPRRPLLIWSSLGQALLLAFIPVAQIFGLLSIDLLYAVAFGVGSLTLLADLAYLSILPAIAGREQLVESIGRFEASSAIVDITGPGLAGWLVQVISPVVAIFANAFAFVVSALVLRTIVTAEPMPVTVTSRPSIWGEIGDGLRLVLGHPLLRPTAICSSILNFFSSVGFAVYVLYVTRQLSLAPAVLGLLFAAFGPGAVLGALIVGPLSRRVGIGPLMVGASLLVGVGRLIIPLAEQSQRTVLLLVLANLLLGVAHPCYSIGEMGLTQAIVPENLRGRANATQGFLEWGILPIGSLVGGVLGEVFGLHAVLVVSALGVFLAPLGLALSPVHSIRELPTPVVQPHPALPRRPQGWPPGPGGPLQNV